MYSILIDVYIYMYMYINIYIYACECMLLCIHDYMYGFFMCSFYVCWFYDVFFLTYGCLVRDDLIKKFKQNITVWDRVNYTHRFYEVESEIYWFHLFRQSIRPSVRLWTESCPFCIFHNTRWINFIFIHLIKQLQKVCRGLIFCKILTFEYLAIFFNL